MYHIINKTNELLKICLNNFNHNNLSKNYGSFDRNYWNYKTIDFPAGMSQTNFYALALAYKINFKNNLCFKNPIIKDWCLAGIQNTIKITNSNGSINDYFPHEQAIGATCFVYISFIKTILLLNFEKADYKKYLRNTAKYIAESNESGILSNHKAAEILALCYYRKLYKDDSYLKYEKNKVNELIKNYNTEGWFEEYGGCDLGYHTVTLSRLIDVYNLTKSQKILLYCKKMVEFSLNFINPDLTYGGHYSARGTSICFLDGYAKMIGFNKKAIIFIKCSNLQIKNNLTPLYVDDKTSIHHLISYLETIKELNNKKINYKNNFLKNKKSSKKYSINISKDGISKIQKKNLCLFFSIKKGGSLSIYKNQKLVDQDSGVTIKYKNNIYLSCYQNDCVEFHNKGNYLEIKKYLSKYDEQNMSTYRLIILRIFMSTIGKYFPNLIRKILQKILIFSNVHDKSLFLTRKIIIEKNSISIIDKINKKIDYAIIQKPINPSHVIMSNVINLRNIEFQKNDKFFNWNNKFIRKFYC